VHTYKQHRNKFSQVASAAKTGISERSARRIEQAPSLSSSTLAAAFSIVYSLKILEESTC
jgi:hypothetical protein